MQINLTYQCVKTGQTTQFKKGSALYQANLHIHCPSYSIFGVTVGWVRQLFSVKMVSNRFSGSPWSPGDQLSSGELSSSAQSREGQGCFKARPPLACPMLLHLLVKLLSLHYTNWETAASGVPFSDSSLQSRGRAMRSRKKSCVFGLCLLRELEARTSNVRFPVVNMLDPRREPNERCQAILLVVRAALTTQWILQKEFVCFKKKNAFSLF